MQLCAHQSQESWLLTRVRVRLTLTTILVYYILYHIESESRFSHNNKGSRISLCVHCSTLRPSHQVHGKKLPSEQSRVESSGGAICYSINKGRKYAYQCLPPKVYVPCCSCQTFLAAKFLKIYIYRQCNAFFVCRMHL